ncbi:MAG: peptidoglycan recognition family protein [Chthoniobacterales bacterium]
MLMPVPTVRPALSPGSVPQVEVEKSGFLGDQGYEPPPSPTPRRGWWFWSRPEVAYRYLSRSVRNEIDRAPVMRRRWQFIVVHNSGTRQGSARIFDYYHRHVRRMKNGLAYHFVIGNGTSTGDGQIEVGDRWRRQINGGHVHSDYLNNIALGICLVGDFNRGQPTRRQLEACEELINYLRKRCGKIDAHYAVVRPHREVNPPQWATDCPGDAFPYSWFRRFQE